MEEEEIKSTLIGEITKQVATLLIVQLVELLTQQKIIRADKIYC